MYKINSGMLMPTTKLRMELNQVIGSKRKSKIKGRAKPKKTNKTNRKTFKKLPPSPSASPIGIKGLPSIISKV